MTTISTRTAPLGLAALVLALASGAGDAAEWKYSLGVHDTVSFA